MFDIVKYPDPILKKRCPPVAVVSEEEKDLLGNLIKVMHINRGVGLAAPQVGVNKQMAVVDTGEEPILKLINPVIIAANGTEIMEEGCLSIPNVYIPVKRAKQIKVKLLDENGREIVLEATGFMARAILHEIDHLKGRLIIDYLNPVKRFFILRKK